MDFIRYPMYRSIEKTLREQRLFPLNGRVLGISGLGHHRAFLSPDAVVTETVWPDVTILSLPFPDETFDVVISDQILEHVEGSPQQAMDESRRVLKKGGIAIHTSVFMYRIHHKHPGDFWRFSPPALRFLLKDYEKIIDASGWGNRLSQILFTLFPRLATYPVDPKNVPHFFRLLSRRRAKNFDHIVWIIAQK